MACRLGLRVQKAEFFIVHLTLEVAIILYFSPWYFFFRSHTFFQFLWRYKIYNEHPRI